MPDLSLQGIRVLDLTRLAPGPWASLVLADLGAEVIKVEEPPDGDPMRYLLSADRSTTNVLFKLLNRNKKSMTLNLKTPEGKDILLRMVKDADVLMEGFRPGVMERLGLDYEAMSAVNVELVYVSISGYGQSGPYRGRAGHDLNYMAVGGCLSVTGQADGPPALSAVPIADLTSGSWAVIATLAALLSRDKSGHGSHVDIAMLDSVVGLMATPLADWLEVGVVPQRGRTVLSGQLACYNLYATADGRHMALAAIEPAFWQEFCNAVGRPDWVARQRDADQSALIAELAALFRSRRREEWTALFESHDCCCEPVLGVDEVVRHAQVAERGMLRDSYLATPLARWPLGNARAPLVGEHTEQILAELGYSVERVEELRRRGVL